MNTFHDPSERVAKVDDFFGESFKVREELRRVIVAVALGVILREADLVEVVVERERLARDGDVVFGNDHLDGLRVRAQLVHFVVVVECELEGEATFAVFRGLFAEDLE